LQASTHQAAIRAASWPSVRADIVVWGRASRYGDGIVVQSFLAVTPLIEQRTVHPEVWTLMARTNGEPVRLSIGLPRHYYEFEPFVLPASQVQAYTSPGGVPLYSSPTGGAVVGHAGGAFSFVEFTRDGVKLDADHVQGWARLPPVPGSGRHAIRFAQAMVRFLRGDWAGAAADFSAVVADADVPRALKLDSQLLRGMTNEQRGRSGAADFESAYRSNPLDQVAARCVIMGRLSAMQRMSDAAERAAGREALTAFVAKTTPLFVADDPWLAAVRGVLTSIP